jgi:hypothetical protein
MNTIMKRMTAAIAVALTLLGISTPAMADETAPEMDATRTARGGGEQTCAGMEAMQGLTGAPDPDPAAVIQATPAAPDIIASM